MMRDPSPSTDPLEEEEDDDDDNSSYTNMSSIDSAFASEISSLSGDSGQQEVDLFAYFRNHNLHGRQEEQELLQDAYQRIGISPEAHSEVFVIHGDGGCGKTCLVESMRTKVTDREGFFVSGKFDQIHKSIPFSAISEALSDLCDLVLQERELDNEEINVVATKSIASSSSSSGGGGATTTTRNGVDVKLHQSLLLEKVGRDAATVLTRLVNNFAPLVGLAEGHDAIDDAKSIHQDDVSVIGDSTADFYLTSKELVTKFKESCVAFLRAIASDDQQVFVFLDNLQFADVGSLEVIEALLADTESRNTLIVCSYQDNVSRTELVKNLFANPNNVPRLSVKDIELQDLDMVATNRLLSEMLEKDESTTMRLSEVVLLKTNGNPYFIKNYINLLRSEGYLRYVKNEWTWDITAISAGTNISDNVVEIVESKIQMLHPHIKGMLEIASCLGFQFPRDILDRFAVENLVDGDMQYEMAIRDHLTGCLKVAIQEGLVEPTRSGNKYKFSHIRVQQAAADLLPKDEAELQALHQRIGNVIWSLSNDGKREWYVLAAAEQHNKAAGLVKDRDEKAHLQNINVKAAKIARTRYAYGPAAEFLEAAIALMDSEHEWVAQYQVMLTIHSMAAEMYMAAGRFDDCKRHADVIFNQATCSFDKMPAYFVMIESLGTQGKIGETVTVGTNGLALLGQKIPKKPKMVHVFYDLVKTRRLLRGKSNEQLLALGPLQSKEKLAAMRLLSSMLSFAFVADEPEIISLVSMRMIRISINHGISRMTPTSLACWGILNGNAGEAFRYGNLALQMARQMNEPTSLPLTIAVVHGFTMHKCAPLRDSLLTLDEGYNIGIEVGQIFPAGICRVWYTSISMLCGIRLMELERDCRTHCKNMRERNQRLTLGCALPVWQVVLNLLGDSKNENPIMLIGKAMTQDELLLTATASNNHAAQYSIYFCRAFLAVLFGSWSTATEMLEHLKPFERTFKDHFMNYVIKLFSGLVAYENFRRTEKKQFLVKGRQIIKAMKSWSDSGAITCTAFLRLLQAEDAATKGNMTDTAKAYDKAIEAIKESKMVPFEALACERAGTFMLREKMTLLTEGYLTRALALYRTWGARTKRNRLGLLLQGLPTASRANMNMTFHQTMTMNARTIPSDANAQTFGRAKFGRRSSRYSNFDISMQTESFAMDDAFLTEGAPTAILSP